MVRRLLFLLLVSVLLFRINQLALSDYFLEFAFCTLLLSAMQLLIFRLEPRRQSGIWGDQALEWAQLNPFGGLKWTRTIDLTLIRRVL